MWHSARASTGSDRSRLQPPSEVSVASSACSRPSSSKPTRHCAWKPCRLPVIVMSWVRLSRSRTGRPVSVAPSAAIAANPCGCISLPPNPPPIRRHCTVTSWLWQAEHVGDDLLRLGRVLGAALHEDLAALVDVRQRAVRLEVEVLLPGELDLAAEHVRRRRRAPASTSPRSMCGWPPWKLLARRSPRATVDQRRQRLVVDLDRRGAEPGGLERLAEHPADGVAVEHHLGRGTAARRA